MPLAYRAHMKTFAAELTILSLSIFLVPSAYALSAQIPDPDPEPPAPIINLTFPDDCQPAQLIDDYNYIDSFSNGLAAVKVGEHFDYIVEDDVDPVLYGFINHKGKEVIPLKYDYVNKFEQGFAKVMIAKKKGYINQWGREVIPVIFDSALMTTVDGPYFTVEKYGNSWGVIDSKAQTVIPFKYDDAIGVFDNGSVFIVKKYQHNYLINKEGQQLSRSYDYIDWLFSDGQLFVIEADDLCGYIDLSGREVVAPQYKYCSSRGPDHIVQHKDDRFSILDNQGNILQTSKETGRFATWFEGLFVILTFDNQIILTRGNGPVVGSYIYDDAGEFHEQRATVTRNHRQGYIDQTGHEIIEANYRSAANFSEGLAAVKQHGGYYGFIDAQGNTAIPFQYDFAHTFSEGLAVVQKDDQYMVINKRGCPILAQSEILQNTPYAFSHAEIQDFYSAGFWQQLRQMIASWFDGWS